jgi:hypothetical protein
MNEEMINKAHLRTIQYWFEDGLAEIAGGGLFLLLGVYFYLQATLEKGFLAEILGGIFVLVFLGGWYLTGRFVRSGKEHISIPRTGYVAYKRDKNKRKPLRLALTLTISALFSAGMIVLATMRPFGLDVLPAAGGLAIALVLGLMGFRSGLPRFYVPAAVGLLGGLGLSISGRGDIPGMAIVYIFTALVLIANGGIALYRYLQANPVPAEEQA